MGALLGLPPHDLVEGLFLVGDDLVITLGAVAVNDFDAVAAERAEQVARLKQSGDVKLSKKVLIVGLKQFAPGLQRPFQPSWQFEGLL